MFVKVFTQIFDSSIAENYEVRHFFEDMLKLADSEGVVDMTVEAISRRTNVPMDKVRAGLDELLKPDPRSRSPEHEGRRLIPLDSHRDWGWIIVNYQHYRTLRDEDSRRSYFRDAKRKQRTKEKTEEPPATPAILKIPRPQFIKPNITEIELYSYTIGLASGEAQKFFDHYESNGWKVGRNPMKSWQAAMRNWKNNSHTYANGKVGGTNPPQRVDRSIGTANEGTAHLYRGLGKVAPAPDIQRPAT